MGHNKQYKSPWRGKNIIIFTHILCELKNIYIRMFSDLPVFRLLSPNPAVTQKSRPVGGGLGSGDAGEPSHVQPAVPAGLDDQEQALGRPAEAGEPELHRAGADTRDRPQIGAGEVVRVHEGAHGPGGRGRFNWGVHCAPPLRGPSSPPSRWCAPPQFFLRRSSGRPARSRRWGA